MSLENLFPDIERKRLVRTIAQAEQRTQAEIIVAVAKASGRYDRPEDTVGVATAIAGVVALYYALPQHFTLPWVILTMLACFFAGVLIAMAIPPLRRALTLRQHMAEEVALSARAVFFDQEVQRTSNACGVLLYVSMFEHMTAVIGDQRVTEALGQDGIDSLCAELSLSLKQNKPHDALLQIVERAGSRLAEALPKEDGDLNELPDRLILLD